MERINLKGFAIKFNSLVVVTSFSRSVALRVICLSLLLEFVIDMELLKT